jgi:hypothetical protein
MLAGALCGAAIGYVIGDNRAFRHRLQAQAMLTDLQRELNTAATVEALREIVAQLTEQFERDNDLRGAARRPAPEPVPVPVLPAPQPEPEPAPAPAPPAVLLTVPSASPEPPSHVFALPEPAAGAHAFVLASRTRPVGGCGLPGIRARRSGGFPRARAGARARI